jgi:hypothetical protein
VRLDRDTELVFQKRYDLKNCDRIKDSGGNQRIGLIAVRTFQVGPNDGRHKLTFSHGDGQTERENGIDEAMRVPDAAETFAAKSVYLIGS